MYFFVTKMEKIKTRNCVLVSSLKNMSHKDCLMKTMSHGNHVS